MAAVVGRLGGTLSGIALAQKQGFGTFGTVACAVGGFVLGKFLDGILEKDVVKDRLEALNPNTEQEPAE
ncbi:hypothetical protein ACFL2Q_05975 [Thermodesulfobacteriota bacterium]